MANQHPPTPTSTGPRRWCPHCKQQVPTERGLFVKHNLQPNKPCYGSFKRPANVAEVTK